MSPLTSAGAGFISSGFQSLVSGVSEASSLISDAVSLFLPGDLGLHCKYFCLTHFWLISHIVYSWFLVPSSTPVIHSFLGWVAVGIIVLKRLQPTLKWPHLLVPARQWYHWWPDVSISLMILKCIVSLLYAKHCAKPSRHFFQSSQQLYRVTTIIPPIL